MSEMARWFNPRLHAITVHEAGHAVLVFLLGKSIVKVSVRPDTMDGKTIWTAPHNSDTSGADKFDRRDGEDRETYRTRLIASIVELVAKNDHDIAMIGFAGAMACRLEHCRGGGMSSADRRYVRRYRGMMRRALRDKTWSLLAAPASRAAIQALAEELISRREIEGEQAAAIIRRAMRRASKVTVDIAPALPVAEFDRHFPDRIQAPDREGLIAAIIVTPPEHERENADDIPTARDDPDDVAANTRIRKPGTSRRPRRRSSRRHLNETHRR